MYGIQNEIRYTEMRYQLEMRFIFKQHCVLFFESEIYVFSQELN